MINMTLKAMLVGRECARGCGRPATRIGACGSRICDRCPALEYYDTTVDMTGSFSALVGKHLEGSDFIHEKADIAERFVRGVLDA